MMKQLAKKILLTVFMSMMSIGVAQSIAVVNSDGVTIYYNFIMMNFETVLEVTYPDGSYWDSSNKYIGSVVIPETVTYNGTTYSVASIGFEAFRENSGLTSVSIPNSVTRIGSAAFYGCHGLTSVTIPNSVTSIDKYAFLNCNGLTSVTIGNSLTSIGEDAFYSGNLTDISIVSGNTVYDSRNNCNAIIETASNTLILGCKNTIIPNSVTSIGSQAFDGCSGLTNVTIPNSVTSIGYCAFRNCSGLTSVTIGNSVTSIGHYAFSGCSGLMSVTIPNSVTSIGSEAFDGCSGLTSVSIPNSVTSIGSDAFKDTGIYNNAEIGLFYVDKWVCGYKGYKGAKPSGALILNNETRGIADRAFEGCSSLTSVTIPNSVTSIGNYAFAACSGLPRVTIPNSVTSIGNSAFSGCLGLISVTIPNSVTNIEDNTFADCSNLRSVTIPNSVTSIGYRAFCSCSSLTSVSIPNSVTSIGGDAFLLCDGLASVTIGNYVTSIGSSAFGCSSLTSVTVGMETPVSIYSGTFSNRKNATLYVPYGCKPFYEKANYWKEFKEIIELEESSGRINFDENATTLPVYTAGEKGDVSMRRTIKAGEWNTIVLPFTLTRAKAEEIFGEDVLLAEFTGFNTTYEDEDVPVPSSITINLARYELKATKPMTGGKPFLIKTTKNIEYFEVDDVTLFTDVTDVTKSDQYDISGKLTGTLVKCVIPNDGLFISGNQFWYSTGMTNVKAFRCWFELGPVLDKETDFSSRIILNFEGEATGISSMDNVQSKMDDAVYDLQGRRVAKAGKGIYIKGGKKITVK